MTEEIDCRIQYMHDHPTPWKKEHTAFINAQFEKHESFLQCLVRTPGGKEKIIAAFDIKNVEGYPKLLL